MNLPLRDEVLSDGAMIFEKSREGEKVCVRCANRRRFAECNLIILRGGVF